jgi:hypothetical protein
VGATLLNQIFLTEVDPFDPSTAVELPLLTIFTVDCDLICITKDSIFIIRDDGINAIADFNGDGVNDLVFTGEPFHSNPQSDYFKIGMRNKIDIDSSKYYARRPNVLISNNGKLIDSIGYLDTLLLKSYFPVIEGNALWACVS